jgi:hypothetical protein
MTLGPSPALRQLSCTVLLHGGYSLVAACGCIIALVVPPLCAVSEPADGGVAIGPTGASVLPWGCGIGSGAGGATGSPGCGMGIGSPGAGDIGSVGGIGSAGAIGSEGGGGMVCAIIAIGLTATSAARPSLTNNLLYISNLLHPIAQQ